MRQPSSPDEWLGGTAMATRLTKGEPGKQARRSQTELAREVVRLARGAPRRLPRGVWV